MLGAKWQELGPPSGSAAAREGEASPATPPAPTHRTDEQELADEARRFGHRDEGQIVLGAVEGELGSVLGVVVARHRAEARAVYPRSRS